MRSFRPVLAVALLLLPTAVLAHSPIKGLDNFYAGFLHPIFVPAHLLAALALGILCGQQGPKDLQAALIAYLVATLAGLAVSVLPTRPDVELPLVIGAAATGAMVALDRRLPLPVYLLLATALGVMVGIDSAQDDLNGRGRLAALLGTLLAAYMLVLYAMVLSEFFSRRHWQRIGLRIVGSWIAASALLVLSLALAG